MANSFTLLADLEAGRCSNTAEVYLLRFWEARIVSQDVDALAPTFLSGKDKSLGVLCPISRDYITEMMLICLAWMMPQSN
ncbi:hypothetical protein Bca4012_005804 [Brassica carinata]